MKTKIATLAIFYIAASRKFYQITFLSCFPISRLLRQLCADVVKLADTLGLGPSAQKAWGFKSLRRHQIFYLSFAFILFTCFPNTTKASPQGGKPTLFEALERSPALRDLSYPVSPSGPFDDPLCDRILTPEEVATRRPRTDFVLGPFARLDAELQAASLRFTTQAASADPISRSQALAMLGPTLHALQRIVAGGVSNRRLPPAAALPRAFHTLLTGVSATLSSELARDHEQNPAGPAWPPMGAFEMDTLLDENGSLKTVYRRLFSAAGRFDGQLRSVDDGRHRGLSPDQLAMFEAAIVQLPSHDLQVAIHTLPDHPLVADWVNRYAVGPLGNLFFGVVRNPGPIGDGSTLNGPLGVWIREIGGGLTSGVPTSLAQRITQQPLFVLPSLRVLDIYWQIAAGRDPHDHAVHPTIDAAFWREASELIQRAGEFRCCRSAVARLRLQARFFHLFERRGRVVRFDLGLQTLMPRFVALGDLSSHPETLRPLFIRDLTRALPQTGGSSGVIGSRLRALRRTSIPAPSYIELPLSRVNAEAWRAVRRLVQVFSMKPTGSLLSLEQRLAAQIAAIYRADFTNFRAHLLNVVLDLVINRERYEAVLGVAHSGVNLQLLAQHILEMALASNRRTGIESRTSSRLQSLLQLVLGHVKNKESFDNPTTWLR